MRVELGHDEEAIAAEKGTTIRRVQAAARKGAAAARPANRPEVPPRGEIEDMHAAERRFARVTHVGCRCAGDDADAAH